MCRQILGALVYTPVVALYGQIGASTVEGRDRKIKLGLVQYMLRTSNGLLSAAFGRIRGEIWRGMGEMGLSFDMLRNMTKLGLNQVVDGWETRGWREDVDGKTTLRIYRNTLMTALSLLYNNNNNNTSLHSVFVPPAEAATAATSPINIFPGHNFARNLY